MICLIRYFYDLLWFMVRKYVVHFFVKIGLIFWKLVLHFSKIIDKYDKYSTISSDDQSEE